MSPALAVFRPETTVAEATEALRELTRAALDHLLLRHRPERQAARRRGHARHAAGDARDAARRDHADRRLLLPAGLQARGRAQDRRGQAFPGLSGLRRRRAAGRAWSAARSCSATRRSRSAPNRARWSASTRRNGWRRRSARSLLLRHPWLQINLLTAFVAAAVVGLFEDTLVAARHPRRVPAGDGRADRQYRLPGAGGDAARHDARRTEARPRSAGWSPRKACSACATACWSGSRPASAWRSTPTSRARRSRW